MSYAAFLDRRRQASEMAGFAPTFRPSFLYDFQAALTEWAVERGRAAIISDCGTGKSPMQLTWAQNVIEHTNRPVLILTPIAVGAQTVTEADKFGLWAQRLRGGESDLAAGIYISNYERLHLFNPDDFAGVVCDESSILKHFTGATQKAVTRFMNKMRYRLLCTATAAPNDWSELGTSSEALGELGYTDMLSRFFTQSDERPHRMELIKRQAKEREMRGETNSNHYAKLAFRVSQQIGQWRLKGHAEDGFWRWVASWAKACRRPSDLGFEDGAFILPPLNERTHCITPAAPPDGMLFTLPAIGFHAEREERKRTHAERVEAVCKLADHDHAALIFCQFNAEGDMLEKAISGAVQVSGSDEEEAKEEKFQAFTSGQARVLITKAKIAGFGLNFQHCHHVISFVTHSYESYYQSVRRCWRFGQQHPVDVDIIATEGEMFVADNLQRKAALADQMFSRMLAHMHQAETVRPERTTLSVEVPSWLTAS